MFLILLALAGVAALTYYWSWRAGRKHMYELAEKIPGEKGLPFVGLALHVMFKNHNDILEFAYGLSQKPEYKDVTKIWLGPRLIVSIHNPKDVELVLGSNVHLRKSIEYSYFQPWFGNGLLISYGDVWKTHRKMIAPTFHLNVLKKFMSDFNYNSKRLMARLEHLEGKEFDCHEYMSECMVETLSETVMGVRQEAKGRNCLTYAMSVMKMCDILHTRQTKLWFRPDFLFRFTNLRQDNDHHLSIILNLTNNLLRKKKELYDHKKKPFPVPKDAAETKKDSSPKEKFAFGIATGLNDDIDNDECDIGEKRRLPFLESMIERAHKGDGMSDVEIKDQVNTIMFEGHDTTAAASSFFLCVMGAKPDIQEKVIEEIDSIFGNSDRDVTFQDTLELKFLERCLLETLRLFPPVPIIARTLEHDLSLATSDLVVPAGCTVVIPMFKIHRRGDIYPNPEEFDPDNFLPENAASRHYYAYVPFSAGPRSCVGRKYAMLKLKILLTNILRKFQVKPSKLAMKDWKLQGDIILKRSEGFNVALEKRTSIAT
ncbi:cytochrome P450 4g15-like [Cimex lectularius]|uniref:Cytochrome P450 n=1 Tax=Cimex lectularius TaxID=79782 RepID=A0A8I6RS37_CIMLE|nr:cytochrome P450 4g15-like [Cimex lectularius]